MAELVGALVVVVVGELLLLGVLLLVRLRLLRESRSAWTSCLVSESESCVVKQFSSSASSALPEHSR